MHVPWAVTRKESAFTRRIGNNTHFTTGFASELSSLGTPVFLSNLCVLIVAWSAFFYGLFVVGVDSVGMIAASTFSLSACSSAVRFWTYGLSGVLAYFKVFSASCFFRLAFSAF